MANKKHISDELLAAYLEGNTNEQETMDVLNAMKADPELREVLDIALKVDNDDCQIKEDILPILQMAAKGGENVCAVFCEIFILHRRGIPYNQEELLSSARLRGWLKSKGTPLFCIGNLLAYSGLMVSRRYDSTLSDIRRALQRDNDVVVGVDREKLYTEEIDLEDSTNHAVVVTHINNDSVTVFDPYQEPYIYNIPIADFLNAWKESRNYMIQVLQSIEEYEPHPVKLSDVIIDDDLDELQEAIAENAHEVWAEARIKEGWTYGRERDDALKKHPDLIPYSALPDSEKEYDRIMARETIRLVKKLGFDIIRNKR